MKKETRGRKTILNAEVTQRIVEFIEQGCDQKTACNLSGVPYSCYNEWKAKGSEGNEPYTTFLSVISRARDKQKLRLIKIVKDAGEGLLPRHSDWRAAAWLLEKGWPLEYGDRRPLPPPVTTESTPATQMPPLNLILSMPNGERRKTTFEEAEKIFCNFPRKETYQPPTEEGKSSPEPDGELLDGNLDDLRSNG